jgi:hypothetical protein
MSERLTIQNENGKLAIKFDGQPVPAGKLPALFNLLAADMERRTKQLSTAAADSQNRPLRVGAVQIGVCGGDDPKTLPRLIPPCPRCGYCGFIEDAEPITKQERTMKPTPKTDALRKVIIKEYKEDELTGVGMGNILAALTDLESLERERDEARNERQAYKQLAIKHAQERDEARKLAEKRRRESNRIGNEKNYKLPWQ